MHVLVVTCAHRGDDARIVHRQCRSLLEAGHRVTLVAPAVVDVASDPDGLERAEVPRASGVRRVPAWREVRRAVRDLLPAVDIVVVHDPEVVPLVARRRVRVPVVWDVHEDFVASVGDRSYIPRPARRPVAALVRAVERLARRRCHLILAEDAYAENLGAAPVVPNSTWVPDEPYPYAPEPVPRVVYVGRLSAGRGVAEMVEVGRRLRGRAEVVLIGPADRSSEASLRAADREGAVSWVGPLPNPAALGHVRGALAGLSLLHDEPNYRHSRPTKLVEYLAQGVPVVTTPLPLAADLVVASGGGEVVDHGDVDAVATAVVDAVDRLRDGDRRRALGAAGHEFVAHRHNWRHDGRRFVELLESWAGGSVPEPGGEVSRR